MIDLIEATENLFTVFFLMPASSKQRNNHDFYFILNRFTKNQLKIQF
jgi:hypothetical protein